MGPIFDVPTWDEFVANLMDLLQSTAMWLLTNWLGQMLLITVLVMVVGSMAATFGARDPLTDPTPWKD